MKDNKRTPKIMLVAGEVSGDRQAAYLSRSLRDLNGGVEIMGAGGAAMREAGVDVRVQTSHLGVVGALEVVRFLRPLHSVFRRLARLVADERPDAVVLVDNEGFNIRFARFLHSQDIPTVFYFPPQVCFWGARRAQSIAEMASLILAVLPHEAEPYERIGARVDCVGHPLLDIVKPNGNPEQAMEEVGLDPSRPTVALMPGSRFHELRRLTPAMLEAARRIGERFSDMQFVLPVAAPHWRDTIQEQLARAGMSDRVTVLGDDSYTVLSRCRAAIVKSGTCTLEMALLGVPMVVAYRVSNVTYGLGRLLVRTRFLAMPNVLLGEEVVPEFHQRSVNGARLAEEALRLLGENGVAEEMRRRLGVLREAIGPPGAIGRAAAHILDEARRGGRQRRAAAA